MIRASNEVLLHSTVALPWLVSQAKHWFKSMMWWCGSCVKAGSGEVV